MTTATPLLKAALALARRGFAVFPLAPGRKDQPMIRAWQRRASADAEQVKRWWGRCPAANIGIACGLSHLVVIDLDVKHGGRGPASWARLCRELGFHAPTVTVTTPSGGQHRWYTAPEGVELGPTVGRLGDGIDTRAGPSYVLAPPSSTGIGGYRWGDGSQIVLMPDALIDLLRKVEPEPTDHDPPDVGDATKYVQRALEAEADRVARAPVGARNHTLNRSAFALGTLVGATWAQLPEETATRALIEAALSCGLGEWEAQRTVNSGLTAGMQRPRPGPGG